MDSAAALKCNGYKVKSLLAEVKVIRLRLRQRQCTLEGAGMRMYSGSVQYEEVCPGGANLF